MKKLQLFPCRKRLKPGEKRSDSAMKNRKIQNRIFVAEFACGRTSSKKYILHNSCFVVVVPAVFFAVWLPSVCAQARLPCRGRGGKLVTKRLQKIQHLNSPEVIIINHVALITEAEADELRQLLPTPSRIIFALGLETGLRISDILRLKNRDIKNPIHIYNSRPGVTRSYSLSYELYVALTAHARPRLPDRYVFAGRSYKHHIHMHRTTYHRHIKRAILGRDISASAHSTRKLWLYEAYGVLR